MGNLIDRLINRRKPLVRPATQRLSVRDVIERKAEIYLSHLTQAGLAVDARSLTASLSVNELEDGTLNLSITGPIDDDFFGGTADTVGDLNKLTNLLNASKDIPKIDLSINSPGGQVEPARALASALRARASEGTKIITRASGMVASAATIPFLAGDVRYYAPGAGVYDPRPAPRRAALRHGEHPHHQPYARRP